MKGVSITSYLQYLHEVSRRILQRGGFDNISTNTKKLPSPCSLGDDEKKTKLLTEARNILKEGDKGLFVGFGIVAGKTNFAIGGTTKQRRLLAPILIAKAELEEDETGAARLQTPNFDVEWDTLALNIDLLTLLLTGSADYDPEEDDNFLSQSVSQITLDGLAKLEEKVDRDSDEESIRKELLAGSGRVVNYLREALSLLPQAPEISDEDASISQLLKRANNEGLVVSAVPFLFFAPIPHQLSTTVALHKLRRECEQGSMKSELLNDLMVGALSQKPISNQHKGISADMVERAISRLPVPLSESQQRSIIDAWTHRLSYVQGPPGTGKSHTITAMMLSAALLGQRVLMVSHKPEAVAIVRRKVNELLGAKSGGTFVVEASPLSQNRQAVRQLLQRVISEANRRGTTQRIKQLEQQANACEQDAGKYTRELADVMEAIRWQLEQDRQFVDAHEDLLRERRSFVNAHNVKEDDVHRLASPPDPALWAKRIHNAKEVITNAAEGGASRAHLLSVKRFFRTAGKHLNADTKKLGLGLGAIAYLEQLASLTKKNFDVGQHRAWRNSDQLRGLRRQAEEREEYLAEIWRESLQLSYKLHVAKFLQNSSALQAVEDYDKALYWVKPRLVDEKLRQIDVKAVTKAFPLWVGEMRHLGHFLPFQSDLFDLVIVDEASQVNIAEIIPAIARGARVCVVGDKEQLGLESVGLFALNHKFEELCWLRAFRDSDATLQDAEAAELRVSKNSILDFVTSPARKFTIPKTTLNEHFRSTPMLAKFTSEQFYQKDGGLLLMRETPNDVQRPCFNFIHVKDGKREGKTVPAEAKAVIKIMKMLLRGSEEELFEANEPLPVLSSNPPKIGVLCFLTEQRNYIRELVNQEFDQKERDACQILVGTTEEFQGNERHVMILTLGLDADTRYAKGFYENPHRFNVATSRATDFTYLVTSAVPSNSDLLKKYLRHFGVKFSTADIPSGASAPENGPAYNPYWTYNPFARESEFERRVDEYLNYFIKLMADKAEIRLYNQVEACGQKRLDFVLHNMTNGRCCAVEVDGRAHYVSGGRVYSEEHLERVAILRRAKWDIVHVPYYEWYSSGWLCDGDNPTFAQYISRFYCELADALGVATLENATQLN